MKFFLVYAGPMACSLGVGISVRFVHWLALVHLFAENLVSLVANGSSGAF